MRSQRIVLLALASALLSASSVAQQPQHLFFRITLGPQFTAPVSGRALIFLTAGSGAKAIDENPFRPHRRLHRCQRSHLTEFRCSVEIDTDDIAFPGRFSALKPGDYQAQAVLDVDHTYNYAGRARRRPHQ